MNKDQKITKPQRTLREFWRKEDGSFTLEFVIWMPIFAFLLAVVMNLSMVFYYESQMLRISQDATRAFSLGRFIEETNGPTAADQAEQYIRDRLSFIGANFTIEVENVGSVATTRVYTNAAELMPFSLARAPFNGVQVGVNSQYIIEF